MKYSVKLIAAMVLALAAGNAMAVNDKADVKVTGKIVPPACVPVVTGGAVFDFGTTKAASLKQDALNYLGEKGLKFSITCDSPTKIAFRTTDLRNGSAISVSDMKLLSRPTTSDMKLYGLGTEGGKKIGSFAMVIGGSERKIDTGDGVLITALDGIRSMDNGKTWGLFSDNGKKGDIYLDNNNSLTSFSASGTLEPLSVKTISASLWIGVALNKGSELDLTKANHLDGMASIQVVYL
ncbi:DUF1120 domain-containing protein [Enterobacter asburiae]|uniref:DUF1120 domain-containing protein n=1 Tax=Scandinavium sp. UTDF21-P1B TaxID=3446379 RepID=UPI00347659CA